MLLHHLHQLHPVGQALLRSGQRHKAQEVSQRALQELVKLKTRGAKELETEILLDAANLCMIWTCLDMPVDFLLQTNHKEKKRT